MVFRIQSHTPRFIVCPEFNDRFLPFFTNIPYPCVFGLQRHSSRRWRGVLGYESQIRIKAVIRATETYLERISVIFTVSFVERDLPKCSKVVGRCSEVRLGPLIDSIPNRSHRSEERRLAGAVVTDQQGEGTQAGRLPVSKTSEITKSDFAELISLHLIVTDRSIVAPRS